jgi:hypothetical protein
MTMMAGNGPFPGGIEEHALDGLVAALVRNVVALGGERGEGENKKQRPANPEQYVSWDSSSGRSQL